MIIDAHAHIFPAVNGLNVAGPSRGLGLGRIQMGDQPPIQLLPPLSTHLEHTPEMLITHMDWASVDKAVLLQGPFYGECNDYVAAAAARYPDRLIAAAYFDPWAENSRAAFEQALANPVFRAVKLECSVATGLFGFHPQASLDAPELGWLWDELERRRLVLTFDLGAIGTRSYQTAAVRAIAEAHPALRIVIAHLGQPRPELDTDERQRQLWQEQLELGRLPNLWFDCAALPSYAAAVGEGFPFASEARYLAQAVDRIGPHKILWGTDLPSLFLHATYRQLLDFARRPLAHLSPADLDLVLGGNAQHVYGE